MPMERRRWVGRVVKAGVVIALVVFAGVVFNSYLDPFDDRPFDQVAWAAAEIERDREPMARDASRHIPPGTSAGRVRELLGEPMEARCGDPTDRSGRRTKSYTRWEYWLGCWSGLGPYGFDSASLDVHFDSDGRVVDAKITGG